MEDKSTQVQVYLGSIDQDVNQSAETMSGLEGKRTLFRD